MSTPPRIRWARNEVPKRQTRRKVSIWEEMIPDELIREMRLNPGVEYQLLGMSGQPLPVTKNDAAALNRSCPKPFRVQSRKLTPTTRLVWVSHDPAHWEHIQHQRNKRSENK